MKFSGKVWSDHGTTWLNFGSIRVNGSAGQRSICLLSPAIAQRTGVRSQYHSLGGSRGWGLLCLAPQLVIPYSVRVTSHCNSLPTLRDIYCQHLIVFVPLLHHYHDVLIYFNVGYCNVIINRAVIILFTFTNLLISNIFSDSKHRIAVICSTICDKNGQKHQYRPENYREEIELLRAHIQDARHQAPKASCFWHNG